MTSLKHLRAKNVVEISKASKRSIWMFECILLQESVSIQPKTNSPNSGLPACYHSGVKWRPVLTPLPLWTALRATRSHRSSIGRKATPSLRKSTDRKPPRVGQTQILPSCQAQTPLFFQAFSLSLRRALRAFFDHATRRPGLKIRNPDAVEVWRNAEVTVFLVTFSSDWTNLDDVWKKTTRT